MQPEKQRDTAKIAGLVGITGLLVISIAAYALMMNDDNDSAANTAPTAQQEQQTQQTPAPSQNDTQYKDGSYSATGEYRSPGGPEQIDITLTVNDDKVTDAVAVSKAVNPTSQKFQGQFVAGIKAQVVGKSLDEVQVTKVSGSSLTPKGFTDAVTKIKAQAKA